MHLIKCAVNVKWFHVLSEVTIAYAFLLRHFYLHFFVLDTISFLLGILKVALESFLLALCFCLSMMKVGMHFACLILCLIFFS